MTLPDQETQTVGTAPATRLSAALLQVRPATERDIPFLMALRRNVMDPHLRVAGVVLDDEATEARVRHRFDCASVVEYAGEPIGLFKVAREPAVWSVLQMQLAPAYQGSGLGTALLTQFVVEARAAGAQARLSVLKRNPAMALYERLGFVVVGEDELEYYMETTV